MDKEEWRKQVLIQREQLSNQEVQDKSALLANRLRELSIWRESTYIGFYAAFRQEVDTFGLMQQAWQEGKKVCFPVSKQQEKSLHFYLVEDSSQLQIGTYGIKEPNPEYCLPISSVDLELVLTPGIVFDRQGYRIGYGAGFYDRFFAKHAHVTKVGLAYQFQVANETLPYEQTDLPVNWLVTEQEAIFCQ